MGKKNKKRLPDTREVSDSTNKNAQVNFNADQTKCQEIIEKNIARNLYYSALPSASDISVLEKAIHQYGYKNQIDITIEELSELIQALIKRRQTQEKHTFDNIAEEMADVIIMLLQLQIIFDNKEDVREYIEIKTDRLKNRLEEIPYGKCKN